MADSKDVQHMTKLGLESNIETASEDKLFYYHRGVKDVAGDVPVIVLIHGYPQSSFMWRHIIPLLPDDAPLFIPDIPGYGHSSPLDIPHNKFNQAIAILSALHTILPSKPHPIILVGHDRGARICHRIAFDKSTTFAAFDIIGSIFMDIVPNTIQWRSFATPAHAVGTFHWPFLANVDFAVPTIMAIGGDSFVRTCIERWMGSDKHCRARLEEHDAMAVYADFFKQESVVRATCDDYRGGAFEDIQDEKNAQAINDRVDSPVLVIYSTDYLGKRYDVKNVWSEWVAPGTDLETYGIFGGVGHFIAEEAPEEVGRAIRAFYAKYSK